MGAVRGTGFRKLLGFLIALFSLTGVIDAQGPGSSTAQFLKIGVGARAVSMGEAYTALSRGAEAMFWNVGGLARMTGRAELAFSHAQMYGLLRHNSLGFALSLRKKAAIGLGLTQLSEAALEGFDNRGERTTDFRSQDRAAALGLGVFLTRRISAGISARLVESRISQFAARTTLVDVGLRRVGTHLALGAAARNLGSGLQFIQERGPAPTSLEVGGAFMVLDVLSLAVQANYRVPERRASLGLGTEYALLGLGAGGSSQALRASLRTGFLAHPGAQQNLLSAFRGGFGIQKGRFGFDYAFLPVAELGATHRFSIHMGI